MRIPAGGTVGARNLLLIVVMSDADMRCGLFPRNFHFMPDNGFVRTAVLLLATPRTRYSGTT